MKYAARQRGFTLLEIVVALTVLTAGSTVLWYGLRSSAQADRRNRLHHAAIMLARSDLESLRGLPKSNIHDTVYSDKVVEEDQTPAKLILVREVFDSARVVASISELTLDEKMSPTELRKPLEVSVKVFRAQSPDAEDSSHPNESFLTDEGKPARDVAPMVTLTLKLPEYRWY